MRCIELQNLVQEKYKKNSLFFCDVSTVTRSEDLFWWRNKSLLWLIFSYLAFESINIPEWKSIHYWILPFMKLFGYKWKKIKFWSPYVTRQMHQALIDVMIQNGWAEDFHLQIALWWRDVPETEEKKALIYLYLLQTVAIPPTARLTILNPKYISPEVSKKMFIALLDQWIDPAKFFDDSVLSTIYQQMFSEIEREGYSIM